MSKSNCCHYCIGTNEKMCLTSYCPCHTQPKPTDKGLEKILKEYKEWVETTDVYSTAASVFFEGKAIITQTYNTAKAEGYEQAKLEIEDKAYRTGKRDGKLEGEKEGQAKMNNSGKLLFQQGEAEERARIIKIVEGTEINFTTNESYNLGYSSAKDDILNHLNK